MRDGSFRKTATSYWMAPLCENCPERNVRRKSPSSRRLSRRFTDDEEYIEKEIEKVGPFTLMFALRPEHITGKRVKEE